MKSAKKECVYGGFEYPEEYDRYEKNIDRKHWFSDHKPEMCGLSVVAGAAISLLIYFISL